jgi:hypothetical protein
VRVGMYTMRAARCQWARAYSAVEGGTENAYKILGLQRDCSAENVRAAFRELAKATHPDTQQGRAASGAHFVRVLAAYQACAYASLSLLHTHTHTIVHFFFSSNFF